MNRSFKFSDVFVLAFSTKRANVVTYFVFYLLSNQVMYDLYEIYRCYSFDLIQRAAPKFGD